MESLAKTVLNLQSEELCAVFRKACQSSKLEKLRRGGWDLPGQISAICQKIPPLDEKRPHENTKKEWSRPLPPHEKQPLEMDGWSNCCYRRWSHGIARQLSYHQPQR